MTFRKALQQTADEPLPEDMAAMLAAIGNPPKPSAALRSLMRGKSPWETLK